MNQIKQTLFCKIHPNYEINFIQVNEIEDNECKLYCEVCISKENQFNFKNCIRIKQIIESTEDQIIDNWPPFSTDYIQQEVIRIKQQDQFEKYMDIISSFFSDLQNSIIKEIGEWHKKMIIECEKLHSIDEDIIKTFKTVSNITLFQEKLLENTENQQGKEASCITFIQNQIKNKDTNSIPLLRLINQRKSLVKTLDPSIHKIKEKIIQSIQKIYLTEQDNYSLSQIPLPEKKRQIGVPFQSHISNEFISRDIMQNITFTDVVEKQTVYTSKFGQIFINSRYDNNLQNGFVTNSILNRERLYNFKFRVKIGQKNKSDKKFAITFKYDNRPNATGFYLEFRDNYKQFKQTGIQIKGNLSQLSLNTIFKLKIQLSKGIIELEDFSNQTFSAKFPQNDVLNMVIPPTGFCIGLYNSMEFTLLEATMS